MHFTRLSRLRNKAGKYDHLIKNPSRRVYNGTPQADMMLGFATSLVPQCSYAGLATILPISISSVLINSEISIDAKNIIALLPSPQYLQSTVTNYATNTLFLVRNNIDLNPNIYFSFLLGISCVEEDANDIFKSIYHSLK